MTAAEQLQALLELRTAPVALTFRSDPRPDAPRVPVAAPSGCSYWKRAAEGETFYTEASDHYGCPIGAHTHGVELPPAKAKELEGVVGVMLGLHYVCPEEVAAIPRRQSEFRVAEYAPLAEATGAPDVVLVRGNAKQVMLLAEAAQAAGVGAESGLMGRPTCAVVPEVLRARRCAASLGCIGNRVYTELPDDELYFALPGEHVKAVTEKLTEMVHANRQLEKYHRARALQA